MLDTPLKIFKSIKRGNIKIANNAIAQHEEKKIIEKSEIEISIIHKHTHTHNTDTNISYPIYTPTQTAHRFNTKVPYLFETK